MIPLGSRRDPRREFIMAVSSGLFWNLGYGKLPQVEARTASERRKKSPRGGSPGSPDYDTDASLTEGESNINARIPRGSRGLFT